MAEPQSEAKDYEPPRLDALGSLEAMTHQIDISIVIPIGLPRTG